MEDCEQLPNARSFGGLDHRLPWTSDSLPVTAPQRDPIWAGPDRVRLKWERRIERNSIALFRSDEVRDWLEEPAAGTTPQDWLESLPRQVLRASHIALSRLSCGSPDVAHPSAVSVAEPVAGARVSVAVAQVVAGVRAHAEGFCLFLIDKVGLTPSQAQWMTQRLLEIEILEIEIHLMGAPLTIPLALTGMPVLADADRQLVALIKELSMAKVEIEAGLLERLARLAAAVERTISSTLHKLCAERVHQEQVVRRVSDLRKVRVKGLPTLHRFVERRRVRTGVTGEAVASLEESRSAQTRHGRKLWFARTEVVLHRQQRAVLYLQTAAKRLFVAAISDQAFGLKDRFAKAVSAAWRGSIQTVEGEQRIRR